MIITFHGAAIVSGQPSRASAPRIEVGRPYRAHRCICAYFAGPGGTFARPDLGAHPTRCECLLWVKSRHLRRNKSCPLYPRKRTCAVHVPMSALGQ